VVRPGRLPLIRMENTVQDITGRVGTVLKDMLDCLQQALKQTEFSESRLHRFVVDAGHELRTPPTSVQGSPGRPASPRPHTTGRPMNRAPGDGSPALLRAVRFVVGDL
jgi:signal transduction histidine kinase